MNEDTTFLTNYGFAILVGIASVCFSWTRVLDQNKEAEIYSRIARAGANSFHCAIIFLLGSALKYSALNVNLILPPFEPMPVILVNAGDYLKAILAISSIGIFTVGFYKASESITEINRILYQKVYKE